MESNLPQLCLPKKEKLELMHTRSGLLAKVGLHHCSFSCLFAVRCWVKKALCLVQNLERLASYPETENKLAARV